MWQPKYVLSSEIQRENFEKLIEGKIPAIIIKNFYDDDRIKINLERIKDFQKSNLHKNNSKYIGPYLMAHTKNKSKYFEHARHFQKIFDEIFFGMKTPLENIFKTINKGFPEYKISLANESSNNFSPYVIRIHKKGESIPIHKDNVRYEGIEYGISDINAQLSCILHLQESESGGEIIIYKKQWKREDEKFREIEFGYSYNVTKSSEPCKISNIKAGDLVIINPNHYHEVTTIQGNLPRITLGMFLGIYKNQKQIVAWA